MTMENISENIEEQHHIDFSKIDFKNLHIPKRILTQYEQLNESAARKKGLTAKEVITIICRENPQLLEEKELTEIIRLWHTDRQDLKEYRRRERMNK